MAMIFILNKVNFSQTLTLILQFLLPTTIILILTLIYLIKSKSKHVYLIDFTCYKAPDNHRVPISTFIEHAARWDINDSLGFQTKVSERSGIGNESYAPSGTHLFPSDQSLTSVIQELEMVLFTIVDILFTKHEINPKSIDILITNCSLVCPTPSLAAMIINRFGLKSDVKSYNLSGMGCSAGILSISLAEKLLKVYKNSLVLVLSMESVSSNIYQGKVKSMLLANCLFRMGGAAILMSNRSKDRELAKYQLQHIVRTHLGSMDEAYDCVMQEADSEGFTGVSLSRTITEVAGKALKMNISTLAPLVLPYSEQMKYTVSMAWKLISPTKTNKVPYKPNFKKAFEHFCIHAGGKSVIDGMKEKLNLEDRDVEASKMTLYRFGNTSSSSTWYSLSYLEAKGRVNRGDRVWQLAFGSGFKCNSAVWKCMRKLQPESGNAWSDRIHLYPVVVPDVIDH